MGIITLITSIWYQKLIQFIPNGKIFSLRVVLGSIPRILEKLPITLFLTVSGAVIGLALALIFAFVKITRIRILYPIQAFFVSFLRGTPVLVQLMLAYYGIPLALKAINQRLGTSFTINEIPAFLFAVVAFSFNEAAYASETIRAALLSVDRGEIEAAKSLGMTQVQIYRRVIIPNAAIIATPTLINTLIGLTKGTSLAFNAGIVEVFAQSQILGGSDYRYFERFISVSFVYWVVNIIIEWFGRLIENKLEISSKDKVFQEKLSIHIQALGGDR